MEQPSMKMVKTIGITYVIGRIEEWHFETIIEKVLGVSESDVVGIDDRGNNRFIFKVSKSEIYEHICKHFAGRDIPIGNNNIIQVDDISSYGTMVEISRVPFEIENNELSNMLRKFGDVSKCQSYFRQYGKYSKFSKSGKRRVWMNLKDHIPQTLTINQTQTTINVEYNNQPSSCNKCGNAGHWARRCTVDSSEFKNLVDIINISDSSSINFATESEMSDNESVIDLDIHIDPAQASNTLEC